ncbi:MAG TPA: isocitrate lyase/PEP mutase family protein [Candidatus Aquilonibacter sp.]
MNALRQILAGSEAVVAPAALNAMMAKQAEAAGFRALYLSGGSLGWLKCVTEATLSLTEMIDAGIDIGSVSTLPLILDAAGGWGDPMHVHRTIKMAERAGFSAIEIEDVVLPKRAHHHIGTDHVIPQEAMEAKIREAVAARTDPNFVIIARTDSVKTHGIDEALKRAAGFRRAGADVIFIWTRSGADMRLVGERLGGAGPLMVFADRDGTGAMKVPLAELGQLGYRIIGVPILPLLSMHRALRQTYAALAAGELDPAFGSAGAEGELQAVYSTVDLEALLEIERRTVEAKS